MPLKDVKFNRVWLVGGFGILTLQWRTQRPCTVFYRRFLKTGVFRGENSGGRARDISPLLEVDKTIKPLTSYQYYAWLTKINAKFYYRKDEGIFFLTAPSSRKNQPCGIGVKQKIQNSWAFAKCALIRCCATSLGRLRPTLLKAKQNNDLSKLIYKQNLWKEAKDFF